MGAWHQGVNLRQGQQATKRQSSTEEAAPKHQSVLSVLNPRRIIAYRDKSHAETTRGFAGRSQAYVSKLEKQNDISAKSLENVQAALHKINK